MSVIAYNITGMVNLWYASAQHWSAEYKKQVSSPHTRMLLLFPQDFLMAPRRKGLSSWSCVSLPAAEGFNLLCHFNSPPPAVETGPLQRVVVQSAPQHSLKKKELTAEKSWKTKHCRIRWTSYKILFSNPDAHISFDSHRAAKFVL